MEVARLVAAVRLQAGNGKAPDILEMECALREAALVDASRVFFKLLSGMPEGTALCPACGEAMHSQGRRAKQVVSLLGPGVLARGYYECPSCHAHAMPKDGLLYVEGTSFTPGIRRAAARLGALESFDEAQKDMRLLCGISLSAKEVERIAEAVGEGIEGLSRKRVSAVFADGQASSATAPLPEAAIERMYIEYDGTGVPMTVRECEGRKGKQDDNTAKTREAKLGCIFVQSGTGETGGPVRDKNSTTYLGAIECAEDFGRRLYANAVSRGVGHARQLVIIADGARWIWNLADLHFPGAVQIVDLFHAKEHVWSLIRLLAAGEEQRGLYKKEWYALLESGDITALTEQFSLLSVADAEQQEAVDREVGYFRDNAMRMQYATFKAQGMFVGSGVIEAGCKNVIGKRLKQSGMHWSVRGANAIIALRCSILSGAFDADFESLLVA